MNKKPNILFIATWYPNKYKPTNGDFIQRHAAAVSRFCDVSVIHVFGARQKQKFITEKTQTNNISEIRVYHKKALPRIPLISQFINYRRKKAAYKKALKLFLQNNEMPDVVHLNVFYYGGIFALYLNRKFKIPIIVTEHWTKFLPSSPARFNMLESFIIRRTAKKASYLCPVSHDLKNALIKFGLKGAYKVIPNVTDTAHFKYNKKTNHNNAIEILHTSHMRDDHKNITGILNALKIISPTRKNIIIRFLGSDETAEYQQYAKSIGLPENMYEFLGKVSYESVAKVMNAHDIFLMFSNYENLPCVISEAHVSGLPVISSNVGGISEMIDDSNGIMVPPRDESKLAEAILYMSENLDKYDHRMISENAKNRYGYDSVGLQYTELYKEIISKK